MVEAVLRAMERRGRLLVEAGTGVGKSFAYLAPAIQRARDHDERTVIATNTIALQEQLVEKDAPLVREALDAATGDGAVRIVLVKGRGNYVSIRRLQMAVERQDRFFSDAASRRSLAVIAEWAALTRDGTLSTLPPLERPAVWERAQSDSGNCMGRKCRTYEKCFFQIARRRMERGDVLICNHALFFSDLALRARGVGFLPEYDHVILDEAHNVEEVASDHFGVSLTEARVKRLLTTLHQPGRKAGFLGSIGLRTGEDEMVRGALDLVDAAGVSAEAFFDALAERARSRGGQGFGLTAGLTIRIDGPGVVENTVTPAFRDLALRLRRLKEHVFTDEDRYELNAYSERAAAIADEAETLIDQSLSGFAYWVEIGRSGEGGPAAARVTIACSPIEVGPILRERLWSGKHSVILTSATMTTRAGSFEHVRSRLGAQDDEERGEIETLALGSPFDYSRQVEVHIDETMPDPRATGYVRTLCDRALEHIHATDGGAFVLFTSFATLKAAADALRPALEREGRPMWAQGGDGSRAHILARFVEDERSVLLGVSSFWQGVDVRGRGLRNVIITRLPFEPPDRPLTEARLALIKERGGDPFREDSLPRAVIRFRQGFGRLVRSASDTGRVVVLDPRIVTKPYGRAFLEALPEGVKIIRHGRSDRRGFAE